jgi:hypothetical protein
MNQTNGMTSGYGAPGATGSDSGMSAGRAPNSGLPSSNNGSTSDAPAPKTNNTLATPSVVSPAAHQ